mmetsp:Transcript_1446/g.5797  ORF Transcript_1446/g.5797 Transcript_1446/m.5797 type:complete len:271 (+) Transcript_1446:233-1045(+)
MVSVLELYSVVLHNQSLQQRRMCRIYFVEDACGFPVSILLHPLLWLKQTHAVLPIVKCYPELIYRVTIFNAPPALTHFVSMFERVGKHWFRGWFPGEISESEFDHEMRKIDGKLKVFSAGEWSEVAGAVALKVLWRWSQCTQHHEGDVGAGLVVNRSVWLQQDERAKWRCDSQGGTLQGLFFTSSQGPFEADLQRISVAAGCGEFIAPSEGIFMLAFDNSGAWRSSVHARLVVDSHPSDAISPPSSRLDRESNTKPMLDFGSCCGCRERA